MAIAIKLPQSGIEKAGPFFSCLISVAFIHGAQKRMEKSILVIDANKKQCRELCAMLESDRFKAMPLSSSASLQARIEETECQAIFWDIDTVSVDNRTIRELTIKFPGVYFFCLSSRPFHPELQDAICYHIYACINRPIDADELFYWLRSIQEDEIGITN